MTRLIPMPESEMRAVLQPGHVHPASGEHSGSYGSWHPIATAPKDGTMILACTSGLERSTGEAYWWEGAWRCWDGENRTRTYMVAPTHWMQLPAAPTGADTDRPGSNEQDASLASPALSAQPQGEREGQLVYYTRALSEHALFGATTLSISGREIANLKLTFDQGRDGKTRLVGAEVLSGPYEVVPPWQLGSLTLLERRANALERENEHLRASLSASAAVQTVAQHGTREDAYDQIDRFLRNNMDDESYADYSQALDLVWSTPPADKENG